MVANKRGFIQAIVFVIAFIALNIVVHYFPLRLDFTKDKRFTLSQETKEFLKHTNKDITITIFLDGELPAPFKRLRNATVDLLSDYSATSKAKIYVRFEDPMAIADADTRDTVIQRLANAGIEPTNVNIKTDAGFSQKLVFPMAMIESDGKQMPVKLLQNVENTADYEENINRSIQNLEYLFTSSIRKVQQGNNPRIGFTESNGELNDTYLGDAIKSLSGYQVGRVDLNLISKAGLDQLQLLIIAKPTMAFTEAEKYKLNYYIMQGGKVVWAIDQVRAELDSLRGRPQMIALNRSLNVDDMLFTYGARVNYNLIADANNASIPVAAGSGDASQMQLAPWPYYPVLLPDTAVSIVKNIDGIKTEFASTIDTIAVPGIRSTIILRTSPYNVIFPAPTMVSLSMAVNPETKAFSMKPQTAGVLLSGTFPSLFRNRPVPEGITEEYTVPDVSKNTKMVVIGDGDVFKNQVSNRDGSVFPLGFDRFSQRSFGNKALLLNLADDMTSDVPLTELRNREVTVRLLDKSKIRTEKLYWQLFNIFLPLGLLILPAIFQHYYRRYRYTK